MSGKKGIEWIDIAKGIAIICVVIGHVVSSYHEAGIYEDNLWWNFAHQFVYSFHMALFMVLSGLLFAMGRKREKVSRGKQILQKLIDYGIPYVFFSALWVFMKIILASVTNSAVSIRDLLLIGIYPISFMWYLYALLLMQIIQIAIGKKAEKTPFKICHLIVGGGVSVAALHRKRTGGNRLLGLCGQ